MRHPDNVTVLSLRIKKELHRKLKREAAKHRVSVNNEIAMRLQDSFEAGARRSLDGIITHMALLWSQVETYVAASELEWEVAGAVLENKDPKETVKLVQKWLWHRQMARQAPERIEYAKAAGVLS